MRRAAPYLIAILALVVLDQASKAAVDRTIPPGTAKPVIPGVLALAHVRNTGAIFGILSGSSGRGVTYAMAFLSLFALGFVAYYFLRTPPSQKLSKWSLALILAGAVGNQIDRLARGHVIDFIDLSAGRFHWPTFNLADSCISLGAVALVAAIFWRKPHASDSR